MNRRIASIDALRAEVGPWTEQRNTEAIRINWMFTVNDARQKLINRYQAVNENN